YPYRCPSLLLPLLLHRPRDPPLPPFSLHDALPISAVLHSPTPSRVRIAARSNGLGKKALAAWLSWWSRNTTGARRPASARRMLRRVWILSLSQTGIARPKLRKPRGAEARADSSRRATLVSGL